MAIEYVRMLTCDKCGKTKFLKHIRNDLIAFQLQFEPMPDNWNNIRWSNKFMLLCLDCNKEFELILQGAGF